MGLAIKYPKGTSARGKIETPCLGVPRRMIITAIARIRTIMTQHSTDIKIPFLFLFQQFVYLIRDRGRVVSQNKNHRRTFGNQHRVIDFCHLAGNIIFKCQF